MDGPSKFQFGGGIPGLYFDQTTVDPEFKCILIKRSIFWISRTNHQIPFRDLRALVKRKWLLEGTYDVGVRDAKGEETYLRSRLPKDEASKLAQRLCQMIGVRAEMRLCLDSTLTFDMRQEVIELYQQQIPFKAVQSVTIESHDEGRYTRRNNSDEQRDVYTVGLRFATPLSNGNTHKDIHRSSDQKQARELVDQLAAALRVGVDAVPRR